MRILFCGGQSAGHIAPLVAVWQAILKKKISAQALFLCSTKEDDVLFLRAQSLPFTALAAPRLSVRFPVDFIESFLHAKRIMREWRPDVVFSKGGALSVPVCLAARWAGVPIVLHESDAVSGRANALVSRIATVVCEGFSLQATENKKVVFTGNPVRTEITHGDRRRGFELTGFAGKKPVLLILGGSQGAVAINQAVWAILDQLLAVFDIIHLTGPGKNTGGADRAGYVSREFAREELAHFYAMADVALSRAGAGSISELGANGIATVLVPLEGVAHDHQLRNAETIAAAGGCVLLRQSSLPERLEPMMHDLGRDHLKRTMLGERLRDLSHPDAADTIADILLKISTTMSRDLPKTEKQ